MILFALSTWRAGLRGRSVQVILLLGIALMGVAYLSASFSPRQPQTVALDVGFSALRAVLVLLGLFWVQDLVAREIERKTVILAVSYPVRRSSYLLGRFFGVTCLLLLAAILLSMLLWLVVLSAGGGYDQAHAVRLGAAFWTTAIGLWLDAVVVTGFAVMVVSFSTITVLPLALGFCFAIGAKAIGVTRAYLLSGADGDAAMVGRMSPWVELIHGLLPDLSSLDLRVWPMYGIAPAADAVLWGVISASAYLVALLSIACLVFEKRDFS